MEKIVINGGKALNGTVEISGFKNAALPIIIATILANDVCTLYGVPAISDVSLALEILSCMGAKVKMLSRDSVMIDTKGVRCGKSPRDLVEKMRGSSYLIGAELGRFGSAKVGMPGGCDFGDRPMDQHKKGFEALGAEVSIGGGFFEAEAKVGLSGAPIYFDKTSVGATVNIILAAVLACGDTVIDNAAREPHIVDLANFLNACGANISGAGTSKIKIKGVSSLHGCTHEIIPDMIEAGTFMVAAAAVDGSAVRIRNVIPKHLESVSAKLIEMGVNVEVVDDSMIIKRTGELETTDVETLPYPGFPTDMHPQFSALLCFANGVGSVKETVWDNRFRYVDELRKMGAEIKVEGRAATIHGGNGLRAATLKSADLRAGAAMIIAALGTPGRSEITDIGKIKRGYDNIVGKLRSLGADIELVKEPDDNTALKAN
jgi:UDP-N-acetylglucosamine 1-carboxyvinyltransferase